MHFFRTRVSDTVFCKRYKKTTSCVHSTTRRRQEKLGGCNYAISTTEISIWSQVRVVKHCGLINRKLSPWYFETSHVLSFDCSSFAVHVTTYRCATKRLSDAACHVMSCCVVLDRNSCAWNKNHLKTRLSVENARFVSEVTTWNLACARWHAVVFSGHIFIYFLRFSVRVNFEYWAVYS